MPFKLGPVEIILILVIIFVIFGVGRLPQLFEMVGRGLRSFRRGKSGDEGGQVTGGTKKRAIKRFED